MCAASRERKRRARDNGYHCSYTRVVLKRHSVNLAPHVLLVGVFSSLQEAPAPAASRPQTWDMGFGDVDDDYDPAKPNDYMEYCRERINKKKQEERDRELKIIMEEQEREVGDGFR